MLELVKNLISGAGSIFELLPSQRDYVIRRLYVPAASDYDALRGDWGKVANDLSVAFAHEVNEQETQSSE